MAEGTVTRTPQRAAIPGSYTVLIAQELGLGEGQLAPLLADVGVSEAQVRSAGAAISPDQQVQVLANALEISGDPGFGSRLGRRLTIASHGPLGFLISTSPDLRAALAGVEAFAPTRICFLRITTSQRPGHVAVECTFEVSAPASVARCMAEAVTVVLVDLAGFILGRPAADIETELPHPDPGSPVPALPGPVRFDSPALVFRVPDAACAAPNASADHAMHEIARAQCEAMLAELALLPPEESARRDLERLMLSVPSGVLGEEDAAAALFVSARTLARRLAAEGTSFREVRDELLARHAADHLVEGMPVAAIAAMLGYHDASGFRRAFKRWHGVTPDAWRRTHA